MTDKYGFRFRDWDIYTESRAYRKEITIVLKDFPKTEQFALVDQIKRAMNSVLLNLAEGSNKQTDKDTRLYVNRAHGSFDEVVAGLDAALDDGYIKDDLHKDLLQKASDIVKKINAFETYLNKKVNDK